MNNNSSKARYVKSKMTHKGRYHRRSGLCNPCPPIPTPNNQQQPSSPWTWRFSYPSTNFDEETEESNPGCPPHEKGMPENVKVESCRPSGVTGVIPCYFEESRYSSQPPAPPLFPSGMNQVITKEEPGEPEESSSHVPEEQSSSQLILVSRILKGIPHSPHFLPLKGYSEVARHSLMNAWDCVFEQVVDQIQSMQLNNFWVNARRLWGTMGELHNMGYNVIPVRRRLVELTDVMLKLTRHNSEINELKKKAKQHEMEKSRLEFEIVKLRARVEAEKVRRAEVLVRLQNKEQELSKIDNVFFEVATMKIDAR